MIERGRTRRVRNATLCRELLKAGYVIRERDGFSKFIEPASLSVVLWLLENCPSQEAWDRFKMLRAAPETGSQAHLPSEGWNSIGRNCQRDAG